MESLPENWHLVEEWDNNLDFENSDNSFVWRSLSLNNVPVHTLSVLAS